MIENYNVFKGIKQVFESTYTALTNSQKEGYLWFVRKDSATTVGDIHFGSKKYSETDTPIPNATIDAIWDEVMTGVITFTISGATYQADAGMTWEQWVNSGYNVVADPYTGQGSVNNGNFYIEYGIVRLKIGFMINPRVFNPGSFTNEVGPQDIINADYAYVLTSANEQPD